MKYSKAPYCFLKDSFFLVLYPLSLLSTESQYIGKLQPNQGNKILPDFQRTSAELSRSQLI
uniref:Putative ovule protein n=1 Tax=Solanum chacoense TaxID=4108 RepID=A0A0V0GPJ5_SOLCH